MVIGGNDEYEGLLRVALKPAGQSAEVVMALGDLSPDPPGRAGAVVVEAEVVVEVVVAAVVVFFPGLKIR
jgi:hypothetical protein